MSVMHTGQPGPMMTFRSFGKVARSPNFAIACSWLPQTCMTETGDRPISAVTRAIVSARPRATAGSRNLSCLSAASIRALSVMSARPFDLTADVCRHQIVLGPFGQQGLVELQGPTDVFLGNAANREADVIQDVVARSDGLIHDVEAHLTPDPPE